MKLFLFPVALFLSACASMSRIGLVRAFSGSFSRSKTSFQIIDRTTHYHSRSVAPAFFLRLNNLGYSVRLYAAPSELGRDEASVWKVPKSIHIPEDMLDMQFSRSGGAGGQNTNKVNTQVTLKMHIPSTSWLPKEVVDRLSQQQANRINKEGYLVIQSSEHRTQIANRKEAVDKLRTFILSAWPRPKVRQIRKGLSVKTKQLRREEKKRRSETKQSRRKVDF